jgi:hypothetical protein
MLLNPKQPNPQTIKHYFTRSINQPLPFANTLALQSIPVLLRSRVNICPGPFFWFQSFRSTIKISPGFKFITAVLTTLELPFRITNPAASSFVIFRINRF